MRASADRDLCQRCLGHVYAEECIQKPPNPHHQYVPDLNENPLLLLMSIAS